MDIGPDRLSGRRTTATLIGSVPSKTLMAGLLCAESALVFASFRDLMITEFLALGAIWFLLDAALLWKNEAYSPRAMRFFMWTWNAVALLGMCWNWSTSSLTHLSRAAHL